MLCVFEHFAQISVEGWYSGAWKDMDMEMPIASMELVKCSYCGCTCSSLGNGYSPSQGRSVKRRFDELEEGQQLVIPGINGPPVARVQMENECTMLREMVSSQQETIDELCTELDEERNAASSAADEAMSMILRLQREKAEIEMESRQFKRFVEEKMVHDQQEISALEDLLYRREQVIEALTCEVQAYKHRMMSYGLTDAELESEKGRYSRNPSMNSEGELDLPVYDYPPLKCKLNDIPEPSEFEDDIEKYPIGETPQAHEGFRNSQYIAERTVGKSPMHSGLDHPTPSPWYGSNVKSTPFMTRAEGYPTFGDDMKDRVYSIDSVDKAGLHVTDIKAGIRDDEDCMTTPRKPLHDVDSGDRETEIKKLYMRLQALEADRESMRQALLSVGTEKAQMVLLKEIAQQLCKGMSTAKHVPVRKLCRRSSFGSVIKWVTSMVSWRNKALRSKYMCGLSVGNMGLLMLLDKGPNLKPWRCLSRTRI